MAENSHRTGRHSGAATKKRPRAQKGKPISKVVQRIIVKNNEIVEEWLAGKSPYTYHMASVLKFRGGRVFDVNVQAPGSAGGFRRVLSRGLFMDKKTKKTFHSPIGGTPEEIHFVLLQGKEIVAVMTDEQASRSSSRSSASNDFNRGSNTAQREHVEAARRSLERHTRATARRKSWSRSKSLSRSRSCSVSAASSSPEPVNWAALNASARNKMRADKDARRKVSRKASRNAKKAAAKPWSWF